MEETHFLLSTEKSQRNRIEAKGQRFLDRSGSTLGEGMEDMKDGAEEEAEDSSGHEDEDGPLGDKLGVGCIWVQFHGFEDIGVDVVFECLCMYLYVIVDVGM